MDIIWTLDTRSDWCHYILLLTHLRILKLQSYDEYIILYWQRKYRSLFWLEQKSWFVAYDHLYIRHILIIPRFLSNIVMYSLIDRLKYLSIAKFEFNHSLSRSSQVTQSWLVINTSRLSTSKNFTFKLINNTIHLWINHEKVSS